MKKTITLASMALGLALTASASGNVTLWGGDYQVDTLYHAKVGPGITQTSLLISNSSRAMRAFYATVDLTNPNVTIKAVSATDKINGNETVSGMAKRKDAPGARYLVGINGDFYFTSGTTSRGQSLVGTPLGTCIADGKLYNGSSGYWPFVLDVNKQVYINPVGVSGTVTMPGGASVLLHGVNVGPHDGKITVYNSNYYSGTNVTGGAEVQAKMADGAAFALAGPNKLVVTSAPSTDGDMTIPADGFVIDGRGSTLDMVKNLKVGDTVTVNMAITVGGKAVNPLEVVAGQPKIVEKGATLEVHGDLMDAYHPRTAIGYYDGGKKVVFMVVDGRSAISSGCTTLQLGDIMRYTGCTEAVNLDGGGSSCLYIKELGARNVPSDGRERADANGLFVVSPAPDDSQVAEIRFVDWKLDAPKYSVYTPQFYGYNKYGVLVNTDLKGVKLSCPDQIGHIKADTTFFADGSGYGLLSASYNGATATIPVVVAGSADALSMRCDSVINDCYRNYAVEVYSTVGEKTMVIDPAALTWSSSDEGVVKIDANTGILKGVANGTATVTGTVGSYTGSMKVIVEKPTAHVMPIEPDMDVTTWTITQNGGTRNSVEALPGGGIKYVYTGKSARIANLRLNKRVRLWSLPDTLRVRLNPGNATVKSMTFTLRSPIGNAVNYVVTPEAVPQNQETTFAVPTSAWTDASDMLKYPITLSTIQVNMDKPAKGVQNTMLFNGIECVYNMREIGPTAVETIDAASGLSVRVRGTVLCFSQTVDAVSVFDLAGREVATAKQASQINVGAAGAYVVAARVGGRTVTSKLMVR